MRVSNAPTSPYAGSDVIKLDLSAARRHHKTAVLVLSHVLDKYVSAALQEIKEECAEQYDVVFLCDNSIGAFDSYKNDRDYFLFTMDDLKSLDYPGKSAVVYRKENRKANPYHKNFNFVPGSTDLPVLHYYGNNPGYDYYWIVEYDVRYSGSWRDFFSGFANSEADLLGTTLTRYRDVPDWFHWPSLDLLDRPARQDTYLRGFFPVYRLSNRALARLDRDYRTGVKGHYECLVPTVLFRAGLTIEDVGGDGEFVRPENRNRFYRNTPAAKTLSPGSFVFRPVMARAGKEENILWHPVKHIPAWRRAARWAARLIGR
jgi:hypothetical protein